MDNCVVTKLSVGSDKSANNLGTLVHDASTAFCTDPTRIMHNFDWSIVFNMMDLDGNPCVTIEGSNNADQANPVWVNAYDCENEWVLDGATNPGGLCALKANDFPFRFFRLCYEPKLVTTGTICFDMALFYD